MGTQSECLDGAVERVTFHSEESGFCVLRVKVHGQRELVTVVGSTVTVTAGEYIECEGTWVNDYRHGLQFKALNLRVIPPSTLDGIEKYLSSGMVKGIGPHFARKLVGAFGERVFDVIEDDPDQLLTLAGIGPKRKERVTRAWAKQKVIREIMIFLQSHGVGPARAVRIYKTYGDAAVEQVKENPYRLALDIRGIGFKIADAIAHRLGVPHDSPIRAQAGVRHVLQEITADGHCAAHRKQLADSASKLLEIPAAVIEQAIAAELEEENLVAEEIEGQAALFLTPMQRAEQGIAMGLHRLQRSPPIWSQTDLQEGAIPWMERQTGLELSDSQRAAVAAAIKGKVTIITGGPGVGKTTVVNSILRILQANGVSVCLCAPTGRAAKRLTESTGTEAKTIHRLLEFDPWIMGFRRNQYATLTTDLVVVDEVSMVDLVLMNQLLRAIPNHAAVLLVGDVDQLPSVGPGSVLADMISSGVVPTVRLTEIFRQAAQSRIVVNAHWINQGRMPERPDSQGSGSDFYRIDCATPELIHDRLLQVTTERIPRRFGLDPVADIQVLTPMNQGSLGTRSLNLELQQHLNTDANPRITRFGWTYALGDKVIQTVNNYDKEVFNGDIGRIRRIDEEEGFVTIEYDNSRQVEYELGELDEISLAYATTIHKSQGSEYPAVVIPLATQHYMLLERNLLYTAVTRGKRLVVLIAQTRALGMAVKRELSVKRLTRLRQRLQVLS